MSQTGSINQPHGISECTNSHGLRIAFGVLKESRIGRLTTIIHHDNCTFTVLFLHFIPTMYIESHEWRKEQDGTQIQTRG